MKERNNEKFLQTYVYRENESFFVSTAYRHSSAALNSDGWYYETLAWELLGISQVRGKIIADNSGAISEEGAINQHFEVVRQLQKTGEFKESN